MARAPVLALLSFLVGFVGACGEPEKHPVERLVEERKAEAMAARDRIVAVLDAAAKAPALRGPEGPADPPLDIQPISRGAGGVNAAWNAIVLHDFQAAFLRVPKGLQGKAPIWFVPEPAHMAIEGASLGRFDGMPLLMKREDEVRRWFDALAGLQYCVAIRSVEHVPPVVRGDTFTPGRFRGEARVYRIEGAQYLGGFAFGHAGQSRTVQSLGGRRDAQIYVSIDFKEHLEKAFHAALAKLFPGTETRVR